MAIKQTKKASQGGGAGGESPTGGGAGGGNGTVPGKTTYKISKIMIHPSRKIGLPEYSSVECSAGMEVVFDTPQTLDSPVIEQAFADVHDVLQKQFRNQLEKFGSKKQQKQTTTT